MPAPNLDRMFPDKLDLEHSMPADVVSIDCRSRPSDQEDTDGFLPVPVPDGVSDPPSKHPKLGEMSSRWPYFDKNGRLQGYKCKFETANGKIVLPLRYGVQEGVTDWHWKGWGSGRPFYRLPDLIANPDAPILIVEGEKAADAAVELLPGWQVVTTMDGAGSPQKTDFKEVAGRRVAIWPDNDDQGQKYAWHAADLAMAAGALSCRIVSVPQGWPKKWDLADTLPAGVTIDDVTQMVRDAEIVRPAYEQQGAFICVRRQCHLQPGVYQITDEERAPVKVCTQLEIIADTRDAHGESWGRLLRITDRDGVAKEWAMPMKLLGSNGNDLRTILFDKGCTPEPRPKTRELLEAYLSSWDPAERVRCVDRIGWHEGQFIFPDEVIGVGTGEQVKLQCVGAPPNYETSGTLDGWHKEVALPALGNSRLELAVLVGFGGPLLHLLNEESGGFHLVGGSSIGKTTALHVTASVLGCEVHSWRTTSNAAEILASNSNDLCLLLDEISQVDGNDADNLAYTLGNGAGKARMRRDSSLRQIKLWRVMFMSTGEVGFSAKMAEVRKKPRAGQEVRVVEMPADAGKGYGMFDTLHDHQSGDRLARHLKHATKRQKGHPIRAFLRALTDQISALGLEVVTDGLDELRKIWVSEHCPQDSDGQVLRVAGRFGLLAAAGEYAIVNGILPWPQGKANEAMARCFRDWLIERGCDGPLEDRRGIEQVRHFLHQHGGSRFDKIDVEYEQDYRPVNNRAGFRNNNEKGGWSYLVSRGVWEKEVCAGLNPKRVARAMLDQGWMKAETGRLQYQIRVNIPGMRKTIRG